jgi:hypothetical protein
MAQGRLGKAEDMVQKERIGRNGESVKRGGKNSIKS